MKQTAITGVDAYIDARHALKELYKTQKGKKFIHHLIYAFTKSPATYIYYSAGELYDCITKTPIRSISTKMEPIKDANLNNMFIELKSKTGDERVEFMTKFQEELATYLINNPMKRVARRSELSNKLLGNEEYLALKEFMENEAKSGNKVIARMINYRTPKRGKRPSSSNSALSLGAHIDPETLEKLKSLW